MKRILTTLALIAIVLVIIGICQSQRGYVIGFVSPPICYDPSGIKAEYHLIPQKQLWDWGAGIAIAFRGFNGTPIIGVDKDDFDLLPYTTQDFFLHHECGHIVLDHAKTDMVKAAINNKDPTINEKDADCYAGKKLVELGYTRDDFQEIFDSFVDRKLLYKLTHGVKTDEYNTKAYKMPKQRVADIKSCIDFDSYK